MLVSKADAAGYFIGWGVTSVGSGLAKTSNSLIVAGVLWLEKFVIRENQRLSLPRSCCECTRLCHLPLFSPRVEDAVCNEETRTLTVPTAPIKPTRYRSLRSQFTLWVFPRPPPPATESRGRSVETSTLLQGMGFKRPRHEGFQLV